MSEKTGKTVKIVYPFPTHRCLEIKHHNTGNWYRVTPREFRSYSRPRRIMVAHNSKLIPHPYDGPIYFYETNIKVKPDQIYKQGVLFIDQIDPRNSNSNKAYGRM
jgi:hypothetical protein